MNNIYKTLFLITKNKARTYVDKRTNGEYCMNNY